jgi:site-specific recombinase XerC
MGRRGRRRLIDPRIPNCYEDGTGRAVVVKVAGITREKRFPLTTPLAVLEREAGKLRATLRHDAVPSRAPKHGTLDADIVEYLRTLDGARRRQDAAILLGHWSAVYGASSRWALTPLLIRQQRAAWLKAGVSASTCNKRVSALRALFRTLNEPDEANPAADLEKLGEPESVGVAIDYALIARILDGMPDRGRPEKGQRAKDGTLHTLNLSKLRLTVMAYAGLPHEQIKQIDPAQDIDWRLPALRSRARRKGKGAKAAWIPLLAPAVAALRALVDARALTRFSNSALHGAWQRACVRVIREQLVNGEPDVLPHRVEDDGSIVPLVRPYDVRHSFATVALEHSRNVAGVQTLLQHAKTATTLRYARAALAPAARDVIDALAGLPAPGKPGASRPQEAKALAPSKK